MLLVISQLIADIEILLDRITYCIQTSVTGSCHNSCVAAMLDRCVCNNTVSLFEMALINSKYALCIDIVIVKDLIYPFRCQLFVCSVRYTLYKVSYFLTHLLWKVDTIALFQDVVHAALTRLAVDTDNIRIILSSHILRIDRQIRNSPFLALTCISPCHTFGDRILMRTGECSKYQIS